MSASAAAAAAGGGDAGAGAARHVCVTGVSGFLGAHIVKALLDSPKGYVVHGTVRDASAEAKVAHLRALSGAADRLVLFSASLGEQDAFEKAIAGCDVVIHCASPYVLTVDDAQRDLVDPAVNGTESVLAACVAVGGVKDVVVTSSVAALTDSPNPGHIYTEKDWNTASSLTRNPYYFSKVEAERAAWRFVGNGPEGSGSEGAKPAAEASEEAPFRLVVCNPFLIMGPDLNPKASVNPSNSIVQQALDGSFPAIMDLNYGIVDVRDVAAAHLVAFENPDAAERMLLVSETITMKQLVAFLTARYPMAKKIPRSSLACKGGNLIVKAGAHFQDAGTADYLRTNLGRRFDFDNSKSKGLGVTFRDVNDTIADTAAYLIAAGILDGDLTGPAADTSAAAAGHDADGAELP